MPGILEVMIWHYAWDHSWYMLDQHIVASNMKFLVPGLLLLLKWCTMIHVSDSKLPQSTYIIILLLCTCLPLASHAPLLITYCHGTSTPKTFLLWNTTINRAVLPHNAWWLSYPFPLLAVIIAILQIIDISVWTLRAVPG